MMLEDKTIAVKLLRILNILEGNVERESPLYNLSLEDAKNIKLDLTNYKVEILESDNLSKYNLTISKKGKK